MSCLSKGLALVLILLMAVSCLSLMMVEPASAQSISVPSVPEFTAKLVGPSYVVNTTYSLDTDTGKIVPQLGYANQYSFLNITVRNQLFTPFFSPAYGNTMQLMYNVRIKPQNETDSWIEVFDPYNDGYIVQSNSDYTTISLSIQDQPDSSLGPITGIQADIQVEALIGFVAGHLALPTNGGFPSLSPYFNGTESGWSNTQTINVPANSMSTPTPPAANYPSISLLIITSAISLIVIAILIVIITVLIVYNRKRKIT